MVYFADSFNDKDSFIEAFHNFLKIFICFFYPLQHFSHPGDDNKSPSKYGNGVDDRNSLGNEIHSSILSASPIYFISGSPASLLSSSREAPAMRDL